MTLSDHVPVATADSCIRLHNNNNDYYY